MARYKPEERNCHRAAVPGEDNMEKANWRVLFCAIGFLICGTLFASCSQTPPEPYVAIIPGEYRAPER